MLILISKVHNQHYLKTFRMITMMVWIFNMIMKKMLIIVKMIMMIMKKQKKIIMKKQKKIIMKKQKRIIVKKQKKIIVKKQKKIIVKKQKKIIMKKWKKIKCQLIIIMNLLHILKTLQLHHYSVGYKNIIFLQVLMKILLKLFTILNLYLLM